MYLIRRLFYLILLFSFYNISQLLGVTSGNDWNQASLWIKGGDFIEAVPPLNAKKVRLEIKNPKTDDWEIQNTGHLPDLVNGKLYFQVPHDTDRSSIRLQWTDSRAFPFSFYQGRSTFEPKKGNLDSANLTRLATVEDSTADPSTEDGADQVEESDLWRIVGDRLFFFNQFRGLQIVDLSFPAEPRIIAQYRLPASGEEMYISQSGNYAYLITRKPHQPWPYHSQIKILKIDGEEITEANTIELSGTYRDSRLINDNMYVVSEKWENDKIKTSGWSFSYSTRIESFNLNNPEDPIKLNEQIIAGAPQIISATNSNLIVVTRDPSDYYNKHVVRIYDLTNLGGIPEEIAEVRPGGRVLDKFKLRILNGVLTIISQAYRDNNWSSRYSLLENFNLQSGEKEGFLELAERETLYATRFDGNFAYIVTFLQTDPLFIIDLSDPSTPQIISELIVPGWSEYIQPMGDQLFAIGVESNQVTASLFDISDKKNPTLADRLYMGKEDGYSWSEANYNEKAIGQLPELNMFLIPYQSWVGNTVENKIQILEATGSGLIKKGIISHQFQARRASPDETGMRIFSISGNELQVTNFVNQEKPEPLAQLTLAWKVDEVHVDDKFLLQLEGNGGYNWGWLSEDAEKNATLRISRQDTPDALISTTNLGSGTLVGSHVFEDILFIALLENQELITQAYTIEDNGSSVKIGEKIISTQMNSAVDKFSCFFLDKNTFIWAAHGSANQVYPFYQRMGIIEDYYYAPSTNNTKIEIHIFSIETILGDATIIHEANTSIDGSDNIEWSGPVLINDQLLYGSKETSSIYDTKESWRIVESEMNASIHRIDLSDPKKPKNKPLISAPGLLKAAHQLTEYSIESYLFLESTDASMGEFRPTTLDSQVDPRAQQPQFGRSLTACAFDGINLFYLDELEIEESNAPLTIINDHVFVGFPRDQDFGVQEYQIDESGFFEKKRTLLKGRQVLELEGNLPFLLGRTQTGIIVSNIESINTPFEWIEFSLSGNFYPTLNKFISTEQSILIPSGDYGVETLKISSSVTKSKRRKLKNRRSQESENWNLIEEGALRLFSQEEVPVVFSSKNSTGWKYRANSTFDNDATILDAHWKNIPWLGNFYHRTYPWIYHQKLKWLYWVEHNEGIWLWSPSAGWNWTTPTHFPYLYNDDINSWIYLDLNSESIDIRQFNFLTKTWEKTLY